MEILKVTEDRMKQILPTNIIETDVISKNAKKALATIINYLFVYPKAKTEGYLAIANPTLTKATELKYPQKMLAAVQELIDCKLITRKAGTPRQKGEHKKASEYYVNWEQLKKPIKKDTFDELLEDFLKHSKSLEKPIFTPVSIPISIPVSDSISTSTPVIESNPVSVNDSIPMPMYVADSTPSTDNVDNNNSSTVHVVKTTGVSNKVKQKEDKQLKTYIEEQFKAWSERVNKNRNISTD